MKLNVTIQGQGPTLLILHGLFGAGDNWSSLAREFAKSYTVVTPDLRNHGASPHSREMDYAVMADDVLELIENELNEPIILMGHSMGGKVAMQVAAKQPKRISRLILVDIAPKVYEPSHIPYIQAMQSVDFKVLRKRSDIDGYLARVIPNVAIRAFLMKNLTRTDHGFRWQFGLNEIDENYETLIDTPLNLPAFTKATLVIRGEDSDYVTDADLTEMSRLYPTLSIVTVADAGHWVHAEQPQRFTDAVTGFLRTGLN